MHASTFLTRALAVFLFAGAASAGCKSATYKCDGDALKICTGEGNWVTSAICSTSCCQTEGKDSLVGWCAC